MMGRSNLLRNDGFGEDTPHSPIKFSAPGIPKNWNISCAIGSYPIFLAIDFHNYYDFIGCFPCRFSDLDKR